MQGSGFVYGRKKEPSLCGGEGAQDGFVVRGFSVFREGVVGGISDDDVVEELNVDGVAGAFQGFGRTDVGFTGTGIIGRMIVGENDAAGSEENRISQNLFVIDGRLGKAAFGQTHSLDNRILAGKIENPTFLMIQILHHRIEVERRQVGIGDGNILTNRD